MKSFLIKLTACFIAGIPIGILGFFVFLYYAFDDPQSYNGVTTRAFMKNIEKEIHKTAFDIEDFWAYEGKVNLTVIRENQKILDFDMFTRSSFADARDMSSMKYASGTVNGLKVSCIDDQGHESSSGISFSNLLQTHYENDELSVSKIINHYDLIENVVLNFPAGNYSVENNMIVGLPSWAGVKFLHNKCNKTRDHGAASAYCHIKKIDHKTNHFAL